ncbi:hypothetical protein FPOAC2_03643 [Fusarium poae]|jgi:hypothetical protein
MEEIIDRERYIEKLLEWRAELLRRINEPGQGAGQEEVAGFNGLLRDLDQAIS